MTATSADPSAAGTRKVAATSPLLTLVASQAGNVWSPPASTAPSSHGSGGAPSEGNESDTSPAASKRTAAASSTLQRRSSSGEEHPTRGSMNVDFRVFVPGSSPLPPRLDLIPFDSKYSLGYECPDVGCAMPPPRDFDSQGSILCRFRHLLG